MNKFIRNHLFIFGKVQGVAFRYYAQKIASKLELTGWIKNCNDGKVEIVIEGITEKVNKFNDWCYTGSRSARVEKVVIYQEKFIGEFHYFNIHG